VSRKTKSVLFVLYCEYLWLYIKYSKPFSILCNCLEKSLSFVIEHRSLFLLWLSIKVSFSCDWAKEVSWSCPWAKKVSWSCPWALRSLLLCVWAICNLVLHLSEILLESARGTGLLPVCGRNLYNCLCSFFLCSLTFIRCTKTLNSSQTLNMGTVFQNVRKKSFWKHNSTAPSCGFSHLQTGVGIK